MVLQLPARCLSQAYVWVRITARPCEKANSDLRLGGDFHRIFRFPPTLTIDYSQFTLNMAEKVTIIHIQTSIDAC